MRLEDIGEDRITRELGRSFAGRHPRLIKAIGDDASVTTQAAGRVLLATTDILLDGTHFRTSYTPPYLLGKKAIAISLSDIAAMGGEPTFFLVSLGLPAKTPVVFLNELYRGIRAEAKRSRTFIAGGNITRSQKIFISVTLMGEMPADEVVYRGGATSGEEIYVTGTLGDAALGRRTLRRYGREAIKTGPFKQAVKRHLAPVPRIDWGRTLAKKRLASAMIDISDGLMLDLRRLCETSGVGAEIEVNKIPLSRDMKSYARGAGKTAAQRLALSGGEDYELLFTTPAQKRTAVIRAVKGPGTAVTRIGKIVPGHGRIRVMGDGEKPFKVGLPGFTHF